MVSKEQYLSVDIVKFIMAILVVGIHCNGIGYGQYPHWLDFINKLAVPFFFVTTGFLIQRKISNTFLSTPPPFPLRVSICCKSSSYERIEEKCPSLSYLDGYLSTINNHWVLV